MPPQYTIGLDFGTNSVRALIVKTRDGEEVASAHWRYEHGSDGIILSRDPQLARQHPADYLKGMQASIRAALRQAAKSVRGFKADHVIGIGVDATGSTPLPVDKHGQALALSRRFAKNPAAMAWLWKDHTSVAESAEITTLAKKIRPQYLAKCGGTYSSEWFFSKILHCLHTAPDVFEAADSWVELSDFIPATLTGTQTRDKFSANICAAGHKAMYNASWGGYPDREFLAQLSPKMGALRERLCAKARDAGTAAGKLTAAWAKRTGLTEGIPVAIGGIDAHMGAIGAGIEPGTLVKIIGTSTCDIAVWPLKQKLADVPGLCGIVGGSVLPDCYGLEAGQSAVGDIFNWFVNYIQPGGERGTHAALTEAAGKLRAGESGLLALDWNNGNRTILVDQKLTGLLLGQTLYTTPAEIYRALIEATAFGALTIINQFEEYGVRISQVVNCGGIAEKNPLVMQIYADVTGRPMKISSSVQTCALGSAIAASVASGAHEDFATAIEAMTGLKSRVYKPNAAAHTVYRDLFALYSLLHDAFGKARWQGSLFTVMKQLIDLRNRVRA